MILPEAYNDWPPYVQRMFVAGQKRIDEMKAELPKDGTIPLPFRCEGCDEQRTDYAMLTGDGLPLCWKCLGGYDESLAKEMANR